MDKKKPIGYGKKDRDEMKALIERTEPKSGDYVGSGTVTEVPKKKKKMKRMQMGGVASPPDRSAKMASRIQEKYGKMSARNPGYKPTLASPVDTKEELKSYRQGLRGFRSAASDAMRDEKMKKRIMSKYDRMSSRFPGYKPTLASPVDTRDELKSFRMGLRDYRKANPTVKPVRPMRPGAMPRPVVPAVPPNQPVMRGGGLARKGVGMALARGGLVKANGCATRGKTKGKMV